MHKYSLLFSVTAFWNVGFGSLTANAAIFDKNGAVLPYSVASSDKVAWRPLEKSEGTSDGFSGIGVLRAAIVGDVCTAVAIDTGVAQGPAYLLSNAHCHYFFHWGFDFLGASEVRFDQATDYTVRFPLATNVQVELPLKRIRYLTESGTDMVLYEMGMNITELTALGVKPLPFVRGKIKYGTPLRLAGIPLMYVNEEVRTLRISECKLGETVSLENTRTTLTESVTYLAPKSVVHKCSSLPGFSGGPLLTSNGEIALLNSHGADENSKDSDCSYASRPCEVSVTGRRVVRPERNYAQTLERIEGCFGSDGQFSPGIKGCHAGNE